jgi:hypothetical protein
MKLTVCSSCELAEFKSRWKNNQVAQLIMGELVTTYKRLIHIRRYMAKLFNYDLVKIDLHLSHPTLTQIICKTYKLIRYIFEITILSSNTILK